MNLESSSESRQQGNQPKPGKRNAIKRVDSLIGYFAGVVTSCAIVMWSVFNTWLNVLQYRADAADLAEMPEKLGGAAQDWSTTAWMVLFTCVVPFLFGLFLLFRTINRSSNK